MNSASAVSKLQQLLPCDGDEACHAKQQQLQQGQLPLMCSIIKAYPMKAVEWAYSGDSQLEESTLITDGNDEEIAEACLQFAGLLNDSGSSSTARVGSDSLSLLLLLVRWLRLRALQMQRSWELAMDMHEQCNSLDAGAAEQAYRQGFVADGRDMQAAVEVLMAAVHVVAVQVGTIAAMLSAGSISFNSAQQQQQQQASSSTAGSSGEGSTSSYEPAALAAMRQVHERLQQLRSRANPVRSVLWYALHVADLSQQGLPIPPMPSSVSNTAEHEQVCAGFAAASSGEQLWHVLYSYQALQQLPQDVLLLSEQLLSALPVSWCCNNPGCSNVDGPSECALVASKSCVCSACRTAR
jgi:hypothetical protein